MSRTRWFKGRRASARWTLSPLIVDRKTRKMEQARHLTLAILQSVLCISSFHLVPLQRSNTLRPALIFTETPTCTRPSLRTSVSERTGNREEAHYPTSPLPVSMSRSWAEAEGPAAWVRLSVYRLSTSTAHRERGRTQSYRQWRLCTLSAPVSEGLSLGRRAHMRASRRAKV